MPFSRGMDEASGADSRDPHLKGEKDILATKYNKLKLEIHRRNWQIGTSNIISCLFASVTVELIEIDVVNIPSLDRNQRIAIIDAFIHKSVQTDIASLTTGPFVTALQYEASRATPSLAETPGTT